MLPLPKISVGITTRNRPASLLRCVRSLSSILELVTEVIVFDDASDEPVEPALRQAISEPLRSKLSVLRSTAHEGYIVGRNRIAAHASSAFLLSLDDDAMILQATPIQQAIRLLAADERAGSVAFAQVNEDGTPWPASMQPASVDYACEVPCAIGFAVLLRRDLFVKLGGYRERFFFYGEEKEYGLRLLDRGYRTVYLPLAQVAHIPDPGGRSQARYLRYAIRNDCLGVFYNFPLPLVPLLLAKYFLAYVRFRRHMRFDDPGGLRWLAAEIIVTLPAVWRERSPVRWRTLTQWRRLKKVRPPYTAPTLSSITMVNVQAGER